jgi:MFS family permease
MAEHEKAPVAHEHSDSSQTHGAEEAAQIRTTTSWKYKQLKIGSFKFPFYASPPVQLIIVAFVCFLCPGMFNALNGMGGGGLAGFDQSVSDKTNTALYSTFAVVGFFSGTFTNKLGIKVALSFGGIGYSIYVASYLAFKHHKTYAFSVFSGAFLGVGAGILWCAQGAIMMSYPPEKSKGRYISWFWMIFNMGAVIGGLVRFTLILRHACGY